MKFWSVFFFICLVLLQETALGQVADSIPKHLIDSSTLKPAQTQSQTPAQDSFSFRKTTPTAKGYTIKGTITDDNGNEIPFATVYFLNSSVGAPVDSDGNFLLQTATLPGDTLHIQALGYADAIRVLNRKNHNYNLKIELETSVKNLGEVTVHAGEDPVVVLMRHIIQHKPRNNPDRLDNYSYEVHTRMEADMQHVSREAFSKTPIFNHYSFIFNNYDTSDNGYVPLYLAESISDYYFQSHPKKQREFIKATMVKGVNNRGIDKYLGSTYQTVNIYHNYIPVFDKKYVSPINNEAMFYYKYKIIDTEHIDSHNVIIVQFRPRRPGENCFTGYFGVIDTVFALQRISIDIPKSANINWVDKANIYQEFGPVDSNWICTKDVYTAFFSAYNSKKLPGMIGRETTTYSHIVVNDTSVTNVLDNPAFHEEVMVSDSSRLHPDSWWAQNRPDSLSPKEKGIYKTVDSINNMPITTFYKHLFTFLISGVKDVGPIEFGPYFNVYSSNSVEGNRFRLSLATPRKLKDFHFTGFLAYGTLDQRFKWGFTGLWIMNRHPWMQAYGYYIHDIDQSTNYYSQIGSDNIFNSLLRKPGVPWKLAFSDERRLEWYKEYFSNFSHRIIVQYRDYTPYAPLPSTGIFYDMNGKPTNSVISSSATLELRYAYKEKYIEGLYTRMDVGTKYPILDLQVTNGFKNVLSSAYSYQDARFAVSETINTPPFGHIFWNAFTGKYFGTLPYPLLEIHPGNEYEVYNPYAFEMMNSYEFVSDQYAGIMVEHMIGGGVFNYIPGLKRLKFRQFWTAKGVIGSLSDANQELNLNKGFPFRTLAGNPYLELGTGVANIFRIFRVDFDWRVAPTPLPGEEKAKYFGVFVSAVAQF